MSNKAGQRFIKLKKVIELTSLSKSSIYNKMKDGTFPSNIPTTENGSVGWIESEILNWIQEKINAARGTATQ